MTFYYLRQNKIIINKTTDAFATLVGVLTLGAAATVLTIGILTTQTDNAYMHSQARAKLNARMAADSCAEYAIDQLRNSSSYSGSETLTLLGDFQCTVGLIGGSGNENRTIQATGVYENNTRKVEVDIATLTPALNINSWQEVGDF
ncbi:MAG: hypothetical protein ACOCXP_02630 [Candidatus Dojkabacteria bacterium]